MRSTPISVAFWTIHSGRSRLGIATAAIVDADGPSSATATSPAARKPRRTDAQLRHRP